MDQGEKLKRQPSPKESANILSKITFFYTFKTIYNGFKQDLEEDDIFQVLKKLKSKKIADKLEKVWLSDKKNHKKTSLWRVLYACYGRLFLFFGLIDLILKFAVSNILPTATGKLVKYFTPGSNMSDQEAYIYTAMVMGFKFFDIFIFHNYYILIQEFGLTARQAFCSLIYRKSMKLSPAAQNSFPTGKIVTLMTKDVEAILEFLIHGQSVLTCTVQTLLLVYLVYSRIGVYSLVGIGIIMLNIPIQSYLAKVIGTLKMRLCKKSDVRLHSTQEVLSAIKIIKMYTWESFFTDGIAKTRKEEIIILRNRRYVMSILHVCGSLISQLALYTLLMIYTQYVTDISAEDVFYVVSCFTLLRFSVSIGLPYGVARLAELVTALKRISDLLEAEELPTPKFLVGEGIKPKITLKNASFTVKQVNVMKGLTCDINSGLNVITGPMGSGKSSFLKIVLQDYPVTEGYLNVQGKVSYASQEPWLFPASIKHNILFGEEMKEERYRNVISVCALKYDLDILLNGDETIVEDNGMNLSKGQQARINLARAIYRESDIYLLDDCLAALDVTVQEHIFKKCIKEFLVDKICLWVTHHPKSIKEAEQVIILQNGTIKAIKRTSDITNEDLNELNTVIKETVKKDIEKETSNEDIRDEYVDEECKLINGELELPQNLYKEVKRIGGIEWSVCKRYLDFGGGIFVFMVIIFLFIGDLFFASYREKLLSSWVNFKVNTTMLLLENRTNTTEYIETMEKRDETFTLYSIILVVATGVMLIRSVSFAYYACRVSINIHKSMIKNVVNATMDFFDNTFIGNVLNRFSRDLSLIDESLTHCLSECIRVTCETISIFALIATVNIKYLIPSAVVFVVMLIIRWFYMPSGRSLKRLDSATRSPLVGHVNASLVGLTSIRAYGRQQNVIDEFDRHQDLYTSAYHMTLFTQRGFGFFLNFLAYLYIWFIIADLIIYKDAQAGNVGLALTKSFSMTAILQWGVRQWALLENLLTSVERALEYTDVKGEKKTGIEVENWPNEGSLKYENVSLTYSKTQETVLKNISFTISPREKIGIIGRTGAGKSSIISTLFRLYEGEGKILIDDVDCKSVTLSSLRSQIAIIPQDPILFKGTIRSNIDPKRRYSDNDIWKILDIVNLKKLIKELDDEIVDGEIEFSAGQRQLFCLARALIRNNKIIVLDEATANMDPETDKLINVIIKEQFSSSTVLMIAHKLSTIMDCDKIIVMHKGEIVEFGRPQDLLENFESFFYKMSQSD